ncbi:MAG: rhodanese-like domain-containing protein [Crocinitomicaceae bacterium]
MNKIIGIFVVAMAFSSCSEAQVKSSNTETEQSGVINKVVDADQFKQLMTKDGVQIIDVRTPNECAGGMIEGAKNIDYYGNDFQTQIATLDMSKPVLVYCKSGGRSGRAAGIMKELGFTEVYDLRGGYSNWPK